MCSLSVCRAICVLSDAIRCVAYMTPQFRVPYGCRSSGEGENTSSQNSCQTSARDDGYSSQPPERRIYRVDWGWVHWHWPTGTRLDCTMCCCSSNRQHIAWDRHSFGECLDIWNERNGLLFVRCINMLTIDDVIIGGGEAVRGMMTFDDKVEERSS